MLSNIMSPQVIKAGPKNMRRPTRNDNMLRLSNNSPQVINVHVRRPTHNDTNDQ